MEQNAIDTTDKTFRSELSKQRWLFFGVIGFIWLLGKCCQVAGFSDADVQRITICACIAGTICAAIFIAWACVREMINVMRRNAERKKQAQPNNFAS